MAKADGRVLVDTEIDTDGMKKGTKEMKSAAKSLVDRVERLGPVFQKVLTGGEKSVSAFQARAEALKRTILNVQEELEGLGERPLSNEYGRLLKQIEICAKNVEALHVRALRPNAKDTTLHAYEVQQKKLEELLALKKELERSRAVEEDRKDTQQDLKAPDETGEEIKTDTSAAETDLKELYVFLESIAERVSVLGKTMQKALAGDPKAVEAYRAQAAALRQELQALQDQMNNMGSGTMSTEGFQNMQALVNGINDALAQMDGQYTISD